MTTTPQILADCVEMCADAGVTLVGTDLAVRARFEACERGLVILRPRAAPPARLSAVACVTFRYRRWAASFLSHLESVGAQQISLYMPADITLIDYRRSPRVRPRAPMAADLVLPDTTLTTEVLDFSISGVGLQLAPGDPSPTLGSKVRVRLENLEIPGVAVRTVDRLCGVSLRPSEKEEHALRLLVHRHLWQG